MRDAMGKSRPLSTQQRQRQCDGNESLRGWIGKPEHGLKTFFLNQNSHHEAGVILTSMCVGVSFSPSQCTNMEHPSVHFAI